MFTTPQGRHKLILRLTTVKQNVLGSPNGKTLFRQLYHVCLFWWLIFCVCYGSVKVPEMVNAQRQLGILCNFSQGSYISAMLRHQPPTQIRLLTFLKQPFATPNFNFWNYVPEIVSLHIIFAKWEVSMKQSFRILPLTLPLARHSSPRAVQRVKVKCQNALQFWDL